MSTRRSRLWPGQLCKIWATEVPVSWLDIPVLRPPDATAPGYRRGMPCLNNPATPNMALQRTRSVAPAAKFGALKPREPSPCE
jgi:hypothetical protein